MTSSRAEVAARRLESKNDSQAESRSRRVGGPGLAAAFFNQVDNTGQTGPVETSVTDETRLLNRITIRADIFGGKPIIRDMRIAVEHVLGKLAAGDSAETILREYPFLEPEDIRACLVFAHRSLAGEHVHDRIPIREDS